jgi:hypothetical protein
MLSHTPIQSPRGARVHALLMRGDGDEQRTACRRPAAGWRVAIDPVDCRRCLARLEADPRAGGEA